MAKLCPANHKIDYVLISLADTCLSMTEDLHRKQKRIVTLYYQPLFVESIGKCKYIPDMTKRTHMGDRYQIYPVIPFASHHSKYLRVDVDYRSIWCKCITDVVPRVFSFWDLWRHDSQHTFYYSFIRLLVITYFNWFTVSCCVELPFRDYTKCFTRSLSP